jgi:hypothetical protein
MDSLAPFRLLVDGKGLCKFCAEAAAKAGGVINKDKQ